ncbi:MAG: DUF4743 domain-containing protein [Gammaproteobacteria bacterium]|nr:MAG: DUF4743 domain-containing protein [Gammaproteobacteria bacterium]
MGYLRHIQACNRPVAEPFLPWRIGSGIYGWVRPAFARLLMEWPQWFAVDEVQVRSPGGDPVGLQAGLTQVAQTLAERGEIPPLLGEPYPVTAGGRDQAIATVDRVMAAPLGLRSFGQHLNGFVREGGQLKMWIGRRSRDRLIFPGALDNMVAGGLPSGIGLRENLAKECAEEAGMPAELAARARPVGVLSYNRVAERGFRPDVLYCYDIELPATFIPRNTDGEVEEFLLMPIEQVMQIVRDTDDFKLNCNLVIIDFLVRHGLIGPEHPDYLEIVTGLHPPVGMPDTSRAP